jgi:nitrate/nitrite transport system substrate-binding protein
MTESRRPSPASPLPTRRQVLQAAAAAALAAPPALRSVVYAAGSDKSEKEEVRIGFIPLTDCASVVMASVLGFDKKYGVKIIPSPPTSRPGGATRCSPTPR